MAGAGNFVPDSLHDALASSNQEKAPAQQEQVWPENSLDGLPPTQNADVVLNPSFDMRALLNSVDQLARRHWWDKPMSGPVGVGHTGPGQSSSNAPGYSTKGVDTHIDQESKNGR